METLELVEATESAGEMTAAEVVELLRYEEVIKRGLQTFVEVGNALMTIRDQRLYRGHWATFEEYCQERWGFTRMRASQLIAAAEVVSNVNNCLQAPATESQARPLAKLEPDQQREAWAEAVETAPNGKVTAAHVQSVVEKYWSPPAPEPEPDEGGSEEEQAAITQVELEREAEEYDRDVPPDLYRAGYRLWNLYADGQGRRWRWMLQRGSTNIAFGPHVETPAEAIIGMRADYEQRMVEKQARPTPIVPRATEPPPKPVTEPARLAVHFSSETPEHYTPKLIVDAVIDCMGGIDLDPCSNSKSNPNVPAGHHYTQEDDGLAQAWRGRVYMNPPYGREIGKWVAKLRAEFDAGSVTEAIALVPARTDTDWFDQLIDGYQLHCFVHGRLQFVGNDASAPFPSAIVYLGDNPRAFFDTFRGFGRIVQELHSEMICGEPAEVDILGGEGEA